MTASLCPFATHRLMPYASTLPKRADSKTLILHTNGGGTDKGSLYGWFARAGNDICSHFQVMKDGTIEQYIPIDRQAYAQFSGNAFGVSVETEDDSKPATPWTKQQLASIVRLARWLGCPPQIATVGGTDGGVGYHSLYSSWNQSGHVRVAYWLLVRWLEAYSKRAAKGQVHPLATSTRDHLHRLVTVATAAEKAGTK
jgi:hypothetical protein